MPHLFRLLTCYQNIRVFCILEMINRFRQQYQQNYVLLVPNNVNDNFLCPRDVESGGILIYPCPSVRPSGYRYMVCLAISSYSFIILQDVYTHNGGVYVHRILIFIKYSQNDRQLDLCHFVCPSGYRYMVWLAISSYSFGATALIFCMMFIHIMEVDLFIISYGQAGASFVSYKITPNKTTLSIIIKCRGILLFQFSLHFNSQKKKH